MDKGMLSRTGDFTCSGSEEEVMAAGSRSVPEGQKSWRGVIDDRLCGLFLGHHGLHTQTQILGAGVIIAITQ